MHGQSSQAVMTLGETPTVYQVAGLAVVALGFRLALKQSFLNACIGTNALTRRWWLKLEPKGPA